MQDVLERFLFEEAPVRGELVQLDATIAEVLSRHPYPAPLARLIGELMAAAALLTATIKLQGALVMQLHGSGNVKMIVVECSSDMTLRAMARWDGDVADVSLAELLGEGKFIITLDPEDGETYQGVVGFEPGQTVAEIIEQYMLRSEQLETRLWLACAGDHAAGLMLQKMPEAAGEADAWPRIQHLAGTVTDDELLSLDSQELLYRLFNEETVRMFEAAIPTFACSCSRERVGNMLQMIGREEIDSVLAERGKVEVGCEFCNARYEFDPVDVAQVFSGHSLQDAGPQVH
ncbi:MAG: Hsp33 family molecular chaperone HslO [Formivibrio sp.]|nr:Hsp33 family molecular chaperone HslO [Formivibrio sp.]